MKINLNKITFNKILNKDISNDSLLFLKEILKNFQKEKNLTNIINMLNNNKALINEYPQVYYYKSYNIYIGLNESLYDAVIAYQQLVDINTNIYPNFVATTLNNNKYYRMLILKTPTESTDKLLNYNTVQAQISVAEKMRFFTVHEKLANEMNLYNSDLLLNMDDWTVTSKNNIYIPHCDSLEEFSSIKEKELYLKELRKKLKLIYY